MPKKKMRRYLKKPKVEKKAAVNWEALHQRALEMTSEMKVEEDPRVRLLRGYTDSEKVLKKLSILGMKDLKREFGDD